MKTLRDKDGRFAGSVGTGAKQVPSPAFTVPPADSATAGSSNTESNIPVEGTYTAFRSNQASGAGDALVDTYQARMAAYRDADEMYRIASQESDTLRAVAGGRAMAVGACASCGHAAHTRHCTRDIQVMSDLWEQCPCAETVPPTEAQTRAGAAVRLANQYYNEYIAAREEVEKLMPGDRIIVARGRKVPKGTSGQVLRTREGNYGLQVLFRNDAGEKVWVAASNIERPE